MKDALVWHEKALYRERVMCYDAMRSAHEEKQQCQCRSSLKCAIGKNAESSLSSSEVEYYSPTQPSVEMVESANIANVIIIILISSPP